MRSLLRRRGDTQKKTHYITKNKLYCWPGLLFPNKYKVRNKQCFSDLNPSSHVQQKNTEYHKLMCTAIYS